MPAIHASGCLCPHGWIAYSQHCYLYVSQPENFDTAESHCVARGLPGRPSHLASVLTWAETSFLAGLIQRSGASFAWIGLSDVAVEGHWVWLDGSYYGSTRWAYRQPDNSNNEDCVFLSTDVSWNDYPCDRSVVYLCKMRQRR